MSSSASGPQLPTLIVTGGSSDGLAVPIAAPGAETVIGSGPTSHLRLTGRNVDSTHARVSWEDAVILSDEGSATGTFVNGEKVGSGHVLSDGDRISIGPPGSPESVKLLVRIPSDLAAAAAMPISLASPPARAPAFTAPEDDPLAFADPAVAESFKPAFAPPAPATKTPAGPAIIVDESAAAAAPAGPRASSWAQPPRSPAPSG